MQSDDKLIFRKLIRISTPIMLTSLLQSLYSLIDMYFLGKVDKTALSTPGIVFSVFYAFVVFGLSFSSASSTMISQAYGNKETRNKVGFLTSQGFIINILIGIIFTIIAFVLVKPILAFLRVPSGKTYEYVYSYYTLIALSLPLSFITMTFASVFRAIGNTKLPLLIQIISVSLNVILDPILILNFNMGVEGAAHATNIAKLFSATVSVIILFKNKSLVRIRVKEMKINKNIFKMMVGIGFYSGVANALSAIGFATVQGFINDFGITVISAFNICNKINNLFNIPAMAIGSAVSTLVAQYLGTNDDKSATKSVNYGMLLCCLTTGVAMTFIFFNGSYFIKFFLDDPSVIKVGSDFFRHISFSVFLFALFTVYSGAFIGGGVTKPTLVFALIRLWGIRVPGAYLLINIFGLGVRGLWYAMIASNLIVSIVAFILYYKGSWKNKLNIEAL